MLGELELYVFMYLGSLWSDALIIIIVKKNSVILMMIHELK